MGQAVQRALLIVALGTVLGLLSNAISPKGIPLITPPKQKPKTEEFIPLPQANQLWHAGSATFLDARKPADYEAGHIPQALNLPVEEFEQEFLKLAPMLSPEAAVIAYCDGTECELSHRLAEQLRRHGFTNVHILFNGMTAWKTAGYPTDAGPQK